MRTWNAFAAAALLALATGTLAVAAPINPSRPPTRVAPTFLPILTADTNRSEISYEASVYQMVPVEVTREEIREGRKVLVKAIEYRTVIRTETRAMALTSFKPMTADGKPLPPEDIARRIVPGAVVLVAWDGELPEPAYLKLFKPDTVLLVSKTKPTGTEGLPK